MFKKPFCKITGFLNELSVMALHILYVCLVTSIFYYPFKCNHDAAVNLRCGELILKGNIPFRDFFELNFPFTMYLSAGIIYVANSLNITNVCFFWNCFVTIFILFSSLSLGYLLEKFIPKIDFIYIKCFQFLWVLFSIYCFYFSGSINFENRYLTLLFGQREHLFLLLFVPYMFLRYLRSIDGKVSFIFSVILGISAGTMNLLKPHFMVFFITIEFFILLRRTSKPFSYLTPELISHILICFVGYGYFIFYENQSWTAYYLNIYQPSIKGYYNFLNYDFYRIISALAFPGTLIVAGLFVKFIRRNRWTDMELCLFLMIIVSILLFIVQGKAFQYHKIPVFVLSIIFILLVLFKSFSYSLVRKFSKNKFKFFLFRKTTLAIHSIGCLIYIYLFFHFPPVESLSSQHERLFSLSKTGYNFVFVTTNVANLYPLLIQTNVQNKFQYLWSFPVAIYRKTIFTSPEYRNYPVAVKMFLSRLKEDILKSQPEFIFVEKNDDLTDNKNGLELYNWLLKTKVGSDILSVQYTENETTSNFIILKKTHSNL